MSTIKKYITRILLIISLLLLVTTIITSTILSERIEATVINQIKNQINSELSLNKIDFSFLTQFPYASINIDDLVIIEQEGFNNDTLIYSKKTYVKLSVYDLLFNQIDIKKITLSEAEINIKYDSIGNPNFTVITTNQNPNNNLAIGRILIQKSNLKYLTNQIDINLYIKNTLLQPLENQIILDAELFSKKFIVNKKDYIKNKQLNIKTPIYFKKDSIIIQKYSEINIEGVLIECYGEIINTNNIDLSFGCKYQKIEEIIKHTPEHLKSIYKNFDASGLLSCNGHIKGAVTKTKNPKLDLTYEIKKGVLQIKESNFNLNDIDIKGEINNGESHNFMTTEINASKFNAKSKKGTINGQFKLSNLNNYFLNTTFKSIWDLKEINNYLETPSGLNGKLIAETNYLGNITFDNTFPKIFLKGDHYSKAKLENITFKYNNLDWNIKELECLVENKIIDVYKSNLTIADSDFRFQGKILNLFENLISRKDSIVINGELESTYIKLDELIAKNTSTSDKNISNWMDIQLNSNITNLSYDQFIASSITGRLNYKNLTLTGKSISFNSLNGSVISDFKFYKSNNNTFKLFSQTNLEKLNIRNTFVTFNNFQQSFITSEHIKGQASAQIQMQASWDYDFNFIPEDLNLKSYLIIEKGELIRFKPLENLSNFVSIEDLKEVKFSTLENTIEIENNVVKIPNMEIKSSALSVFISGTHTFAQKIDYRIKLLLSEIISTKFRKKNTQIEETEFGEIQKESKIFNTIYFKMTGDAEDPYVSFDGLRFKEDIKKSIKKEKETITNIIKEDILKNKEKENKEKGQDITIEWDDKE